MTETAPLIEPTISVDDAGQILGLHPNKIYDLAASGELASFKYCGRRRFRVSDVEAFLERHREPASKSNVTSISKGRS